MAASNRPIAPSANEHGVPHVGTYRRELPVNLERLYENAVDWAHLPYLHSSTFARVECIAAGDWGFRARVWQHARGDGQPLVIDLRLDRNCGRWITRTIEGPGNGTEIWTYAFSVGERRTDVVVDFFVPGVTEDRVEFFRKFFVDLYARLYDEDVAMMTLRQQRLDSLAQRKDRKAKPTCCELGPLESLREQLPLVVELSGQRFRLLELNSKLIAHSAVCPHMLGPLDQTTIDRNGAIQCPWHGYRFDVSAGTCLTSPLCVLARAPMVQVDPITSHVTLVVLDP